MPIKILGDEIAYDGQFIQTVQRKFLDKDGREQIWEMVRRKVFGRIVLVVAITPDNKVVLEKIYRIPLKEYILELPAGLIDEKGEDEKDAAARELLEETGYAVQNMELLCAGPFNAGLSADDLAVYVGTNATKIQEPHLESTEDIEVITVPAKNLLDHIAKTDLKADLKIAAVLPFLEQRGLL